MKKLNKSIALLACVTAVTSCTSVDSTKLQFSESRMKGSNESEQSATELDVGSLPQQGQQFSQLTPYRPSAQSVRRPVDLLSLFDDQQPVEVLAEQMTMQAMINFVMKDLLQTNYVLSNNLPGMSDTVSFTASSNMTKRSIFKFLSELLAQKGIGIVYKDDVFYMHPVSEIKAESAVSIGRSPSSVSGNTGNMLQIVPLRFGNNISLERTIRELTKATVDSDLNSQTLFITGARQDILKALDLVALLDVPTERGRNVGLIKLIYISPAEFNKQITALLTAEGVSNIAAAPGQPSILNLVTIDHIGAVVAFSAEASLLERVKFWADKLDVPSEGPEKRYYIYNPRYARAADLGESIANLIAPGRSSETNRSGNQSRDTASAFNNSQGDGARQQSTGGETKQSISVQGNNLSLTIDERSNSLIFFSTGRDYQSILPMLERLDIMPKQVVIDAMIAEVIMTDQFAQGFEFAVKNGKLNYGTQGAFGVTGMGGMSFTYVDSLESITAKLNESKGLVNVLSNPSIVVRDGVAAYINVGSDIPTVSSTTTDPLLSNRETRSITYRKTGLELSVLPTINAQGLVVMEIEQRISNSTPGSAIEGSPAIFERSLRTEVIADSGQAVVLGGLISENTTTNNSGVPGLSALPLLGNLFKSKTDNKEKRELLLLITPRVIDSSQQWNYINDRFRQGFKYLQVQD